MLELLQKECDESSALPFAIGTEFSVYPASFRNTELVFFYERSVDLSDFKQGNELFVPSLDMRRTSQFSLTNRGVNKAFLDPQYSNHLKAYTSNQEIQDYLDQVRLTKKIAPIDSSAIAKTGYHAGKLFYFTPLRQLFASPIDLLKRMETKGFYGRSNGVTYFSVNRNTALVHGKSSENSTELHGIGHPNTRLLLLTINVRELTRKRNVFIDPESLAMTNEFGANFVVHQGIPVSAVSSLDIIQFRGMRQYI